MTSRDLAFVGVRLLALYCGVFAFGQITTFATGAIFYSESLAEGWAAGYSIPILVYAGLGLCLWIFAEPF